MYDLGCLYSHGSHELPQNHAKALELYHRAGELEYATSYYSIGNAYYAGDGVERDEKKALHYYWELAAMGGDTDTKSYVIYLIRISSASYLNVTSYLNMYVVGNAQHTLW